MRRLCRLVRERRIRSEYEGELISDDWASMGAIGSLFGDPDSAEQRLDASSHERLYKLHVRPFRFRLSKLRVAGGDREAGRRE